MARIIGSFALTGDNSLSSYDASELNDGDAAIVFDNKKVLTYSLSNSSGALDDGDTVITPSGSAGSTRWLKVTDLDSQFGSITGVFETLLHTLDNPNAYGTSEDDNFSYSVDLSDTYCVVGAYREDDSSGLQSGKAYIFNNVTGALLHTLDNPNPFGTSEGDYFGNSVAISDIYCLVGAYPEDDSGGNSSGKAYIFNTVTGALLHTLDNPNAYGTSPVDYFGASLAINDTYCVVSAYREDDSGGVESGKVYIFNNATGSLLHTLDNPNPYGTSANDYFGRSVAISDTYCLVGAYGEDDSGGTTSGKAYIFDNATGTLLHTLDNPNAYGTSTSDYFGRSTGITDIYCVVGAYQEDDSGGDQSGKVYIFNTITGALLHTLDNPNPFGTSEGDYFGQSVAISDTYCLVGAFGEDDSGIWSGKAYIFDNATGALLQTLDNPNAYGTSEGDSFGNSVAINDNYCVVSGHSEDDAGGLSSGKTYIFKV